ncbi:MAG: cell division protein FtsA [Bacteroidaceae bacterium]|nr:cell division protein FtsA [Bacteroidaceae bacterium]
MGAEKNIVAIELGSSSIRAIVGQKMADGSLHVTGFEKEYAPDSIHKGVVFNIDKTTQAIQAIRKRLEERGHFVIDRVCVGISGQSLHTIANSVTRQFDIKVTISDEVVDSLLDENRAHTYPGSEILDVVPQEFKLGSSTTHEPVGIMTDRIEGYYKNIVARKSLRDSISHCLQGAKLDVADYFISPLLLSNYLLTDTEKRSGCALVDFGAETTTVAVYEKNILRHLVVIPLGGNNITADIATSLHIEHEEAEQLKLTYGSAYTDEEKIDQQRTISISNERSIELKKLLNLIEARQQEILANVWQQIKDYSDRLLAGVIFTGGAANIPNLESAFVKYHHFDKVKTRFMPATTGFATHLKIDQQANMLATLVAMLRLGDTECTSERHEPVDLFDQAEEEEPVATNKPNTPSSGTGVVIEKKSTEQETEPATTEQPVETKPEEPEEPKKPGALKRFFRKVSNVLEGLVEEK